MVVCKKKKKIPPIPVQAPLFDVTDVPPIKSLFLHTLALNLSRSCDLLWPVGCGESDIMGFPTSYL